MAKKVTGYDEVQIPAGKGYTTAPPVGQHLVNTVLTHRRIHKAVQC